ncbi:MAG: hypothetical protein ACYSW4_05635 [Planctomycetota bacterium]|jgi:hypothetical protein
MLRKDLIICKTRELLNEFMAPIVAEADKPRQKFVRQAVRAILFSGSLIVTELARWIRDDCSDIFYRLNHLITPWGKLTARNENYYKLAPPESQDPSLIPPRY